MMDWSPYKTVSDKLSLHERRRETRHLDELNESPFSYSQYSFLDANPSMLYPTQGQTEEARNAKHISQYSAQGGIAATTQFMGYNTNTPMLGKPTPLSSQDAHTMHNTPQCMPDPETQTRSQRSRACSGPPKADVSVEPFQCEWNGCRSTKSFGRLHVLWRHIETQHLFPGAYKCHREGCGRSFNRKDNLGEHALRVHGERKI